MPGKNVRTLTLAFAAAATAALAVAGDWTWRMPVKMYQNLDFEKRATIDKAVDAYIKAETAAQQNKSVPDVQIPLFRAASAEWKKYSVQYELDYDDDAVKAYVLFMQGMSSKGARDRNAAMKTFEELLDFYPTESWIVPAAQFMIGDCQYANGENNKAKGTFLEMLSDPKAAEHPLACRAYNRLATIFWKLGKVDEATKNWLQASDPIYKDIASGDWRSACETLPQAYAIGGKWKELTSFVFRDLDPQNAKGRANAVQGAEDVINGRRWYWNEWWYDAKYVDKLGEKDKAIKELNKGFAKWHEDQKAVFLADGRDWEYYKRAFSYRRAIDLADAKKLIGDMTKYVKSSPDDVRSARAKDLAIMLADARLFDEAHTIEPLVADPLARLWLSYEIDRRAGAWDACVLTLEQIIANKDPEVSLSGKKTLAWVYKDAIHDYEKALKIYQEISVPPGTLWDIQYCYRRLGKKTETFATLQDLTFFPDQAARATWTMAEYYREDGEKEKAIALYRRLLSQPEWKKTGESSQAHQRLEAWGIATGGAVVETIR